MSTVSQGLRITSWIKLAAGFSALSIFSTVYMPIFLLFLPSRKIRIQLGNIYGKIISPIVLTILGTRLKLIGKDNLNATYPAIYLSNHSSQLDPLVAIQVAPIGGCGVAKKEILNVPFFGWAYRLAGHLTLDRSNRESAIKSMQEMGEIMKRNNIGVWIWPEGTRSVDGTLLQFKKGFAHIALQTKLPIIPLVVRGAHDLWQNKTFVVRSGTFTVEALPPISTTEWTEENLKEHIASIEQVYRDALGQTIEINQG